MISASESNTRMFLIGDMTRYEIKLNGRLINDLHDRFEDASAELDREEKSRERRLPRNVREKWRNENRRGGDRRTTQNQALRRLVEYLRARIEEELWLLNSLVSRDADFRKTLSFVVDEAERRQLILAYAAELGATEQQLKDDAAAFERWFGADAIGDRFLKKRGEHEQRLAFALQRFGYVLSQLAVRIANDQESGVALWQRVDGEGMLRDSLRYAGDFRVPLAALQCVHRFLDGLERAQRSLVISDTTHSYLMQATSDPSVATWLQCEAFSVLQLSDPAEAGRVVARRLRTPQNHDDMFVRRHALRLLVDHGGLQQNVDALLEVVSSDPSPFVRQQLAESVWDVPMETGGHWIEHLAFVESHPQVRAMLLASALKRAKPEHRIRLLRILPQCFQASEDTFVLRTALHVADEWLQRWQAESESTGDAIDADSAAITEEVAGMYRRSILPPICQLQQNADSLQVRRWAAKTAESIRLQLDPVARKLKETLSGYASETGPGDVRRIPNAVFRGIDETTIGRTLAVMAQRDFGIDLQKTWFGYRLVRGPVFGVRAWRLLYEMTRAATDKRQAFRHTIGRISDAALRAPSQIMGELSLTKVPGEPFMIADEGTWRPYLPLPDDYISALGISWLWNRDVKFFTSEGITTVRSPRTPWGKAWAWFTLTRRFAEFASARNWTESRSAAPNEYTEKLAQIGFKTTFVTYEQQEALASSARNQAANDSSLLDESVTRFFPALFAVGMPDLMVPLWNIVLEYGNYFSAAYENNIYHLLFFGLAFGALFLAKHAYSNATYRHARQRIPLSLGGWGTRGKSGTERLKAALIAEMGHGMVSKTTGCEAMFIHSHAFGDQLEIPLFRPYDKATIWEQRDLLRLAARLEPSVFLWECMALTPSYVDVLQRQWTQDDLSTVTNTYPDHEDLQGPAGYNVAQTISGFVPRAAKVITTEQEMRPVVRRSCEEVDTSLRGVGWLESGLITDDVLDRFPYKEHPDNIALVAAMADELGVTYDVSVKAMADHLVPDLGVLKTYPVATIRRRDIEFTNGMSANERFGCLGNWTRLGYDQHHPHDEPQTWISTVVNNRADRVARSRVFASILVNDVSADRHFLIGTNLDGFAGFVREELDTVMASTTLVTGESFDAATAGEMFQATAIRYRQPTEAQHVRDNLELMIRNSLAESDSGRTSPDECVAAVLQRWDEPSAVRELLTKQLAAEFVDAIEARQTWQLRALQEYLAFAGKIGQATSDQVTTLDDEYRTLLRTWFERKLVVIESPETTGEQIIERIACETPPGVRNRVMGVQNIKGTGMDFIYRFQAWDACYEACRLVHSRDQRVIKKGLESLCEFPVLGQLCEQKVKATVEFARTSTQHQQPEYQTMLNEIELKVEASLGAIRSSFGQSTETELASNSAWSDWIVAKTEELLDVNDAARRRQKADTIYRDLGAGRISRQRAVEELRKINKRQKGGWLAAALRARKGDAQ